MDDRHPESTNISFKQSTEKKKKTDALNNNLWKDENSAKKLQNKAQVNLTDKRNLIHSNVNVDHAKKLIKIGKRLVEVQQYVQSEPSYVADQELTKETTVCDEAYIDKGKTEGSAEKLIEDLLQTSVSKNSQNCIAGSLQDKNKSFLAQWKYNVDNIEPISLKEELERHQFLVTKNFIDFEKKQRSHQVSLLLIAAYRNIRNDRDFSMFQKIISNARLPCATILDKPLKENAAHIGDIDDNVLGQYKAVLTRHRSELEIKLRSSDFLEIVNDFVEDSIVDLDQLEKLVSAFPNRESITYFIDIVLDNWNKRSCHCLVKSFKNKNRFRRFQFFLTEVEKSAET